MAKEDDLILQKHRQSLVEAALAFNRNNKLRSYKNIETGEVVLPEDSSFHKQLAYLLPEFSDHDPYVMFKNIAENANSERVKQLLYPLPEIQEAPTETNEPKSAKKETAEEKIFKYFKDSPKPEEEEKKGEEEKPEEAPNQGAAETSTEDTLNETANNQPTPEPKGTFPPDSSQSSANTDISDIKPSEGQDVAPNTPIKVTIKPLPPTFPNQKQTYSPKDINANKPSLSNQKPIEPKVKNTGPINPTIPTANRSEQKTEKSAQPNIQNISNQKPTEKTSQTAPPVEKKPSFFQRIKQILFAAAASETAQSVAKEASFQAQMGIKKGIDKTTQEVSSFARSGVKSARELIQPGSTSDEAFEVDDFLYDGQEPNIYYGQGGRKPGYYLGPQKPPSGRISSVAKKSLWRNPWVIGGIIFIFYLFFIEEIQNDIGPLMANVFNEQAYVSSVAPSAEWDVASCDFTYKGQSVAIKSQRLKNIFSEVSQLTGVPASVLASVAVHESPVFTLQAEDSHQAFSGTGYSGVDCLPHFPTSPTGALGLMQVQAPSNLRPKNAPSYNPNAFSKEGVEIGLKFLNRDLNSLTTRDFCDLRTNIILGAGVLIAKNGGTPPTTGEEVKEAVCRYYGQCEYGIYNYGEEVQRDFESCRAPSNTQLIANAQNSFCPIPNGVVTCGSQANPINSCGHCGLNYSENMSICASFPATRYAMDIAANARQAVILPTLGSKIMKWEWKGEESKGVDAIQRYVGTDVDTGNTYLLQLHHTQSGSGKRGISSSGEQGGIICNNCNHLHIQLGQGSTLGNTNWLDTTRYFCQTQSSNL